MPAFLSRIPLYPILLTLYAILFVYAENLALIFPGDVAIVALVTIPTTLLIWSIARVLFRKPHKAAAVTGVCVAAFFAYGHLVNLVQPSQERPNHALFVPLVLGVALVLIVIIARARRLGQLTLFLNVITLALLVVPVLRIAQYHLAQITTPRATSATAPPSHPMNLNDAEHPDIYYLILDGYSSNSHLLREWGYDNSAFTDALEERGFFVAYDSTSNYGITVASLSSSLNMRYLNSTEQQATREANLDYARTLMVDNAVAAELQQQGYTYIHILSGFGKYSNLADVNIDVFPGGIRRFSARDEMPPCNLNNECHKVMFLRFFFDTTMLMPVLEHPIAEAVLAYAERTSEWNPDRPLVWESPRRALAIWDEMEHIATMPEATFTFGHIIKPHIPILFDAQGRYPDWGVRHGEAAYFDQLTFINNRTLAMIDAIIEQSDVPPIIIVQGDHGSELGYGWNGDDVHPVFFEIMNAYHFPDAPEGTIPPDITPVNSFRLLFNTYFDADYEMLDNRHFDVVNGYDDFFNMVPVDPTDVLANPEAYE